VVTVRILEELGIVGRRIDKITTMALTVDTGLELYQDLRDSLKPLEYLHLASP
jgi:hypothetical protein